MPLFFGKSLCLEYNCKSVNTSGPLCVRTRHPIWMHRLLVAKYGRRLLLWRNLESHSHSAGMKSIASKIHFVVGTHSSFRIVRLLRYCPLSLRKMRNGVVVRRAFVFLCCLDCAFLDFDFVASHTTKPKLSDSWHTTHGVSILTVTTVPVKNELDSWKGPPSTRNPSIYNRKLWTKAQ